MIVRGVCCCCVCLRISSLSTQRPTGWSSASSRIVRLGRALSLLTFAGIPNFQEDAQREYNINVTLQEKKALPNANKCLNPEWPRIGELMVWRRSLILVATLAYTE